MTASVVTANQIQARPLHLLSLCKCVHCEGGLKKCAVSEECLPLGPRTCTCRNSEVAFAQMLPLLNP